MIELTALRPLVAARLVQARELRGKSQRALGDMLGVGKVAGATRVNRYERQAKSASLPALQQLAEALQVPPAYFLAQSAEVADLLLALDGAPDELVAELSRLVRRAVENPALLESWKAATPDQVPSEKNASSPGGG